QFTEENQNEDTSDKLDQIVEEKGLISSVSIEPIPSQPFSKRNSVADELSENVGFERKKALLSSKNFLDPKRDSRLLKNVFAVLKNRQEQELMPNDSDLLKQNAENRAEQKMNDESKEIRQKLADMRKEHLSLQKRTNFLKYQKRIVEENKLWQSNLESLTYFIRTEAKPRLFFQPKRMTPTFKQMHRNTEQKVRKVLAQKKQSLMELLQDNEENFNSRQLSKTNCDSEKIEADNADELVSEN
ncbi:MAG: hypothetical protein MHPSP_001241, partial [Paramarteilia canceri]